MVLYPYSGYQTHILQSDKSVHCYSKPDLHIRRYVHNNLRKNHTSCLLLLFFLPPWNVPDTLLRHLLKNLGLHFLDIQHLAHIQDCHLQTKSKPPLITNSSENDTKDAAKKIPANTFFIITS